MTVQSLPFTHTLGLPAKPTAVASTTSDSTKYLASSPCSSSTTNPSPSYEDGQPKHTKPPPAPTPSSSSTTTATTTERVSSSCAMSTSTSSSSSSSRSPSPPSSSAPRFVGRMSASEFVNAMSAYLGRRLDGHAGAAGAAGALGAVSVLERVFYSEYDPKIEVRGYVRRLVVHARCSPAAFVVALVLWERFHERQAHLVPSALNVHRLLITALMVAAKCTDDATARARFFAALGGMAPGSAEIVHMEASFLALVDYRVLVTAREFDQQVAVLEQLVGKWPLNA